LLWEVVSSPFPCSQPLLFFPVSLDQVQHSTPTSPIRFKGHFSVCFSVFLVGVSLPRDYTGLFSQSVGR
jgi:hypothetical protein